MSRNILSHLVRLCLLVTIGLSILGTSLTFNRTLNLPLVNTEQQIESSGWLPWQMFTTVTDSNGEKLFSRKLFQYYADNTHLFSRSTVTWRVAREEGEQLTDLSVLPLKLLPRPPPFLLS